MFRYENNRNTHINQYIHVHAFLFEYAYHREPHQLNQLV